MKTIKFGTDGWRAIIGQDFTFENVEKVIQAYADLKGPSAPQKPFILGYDRRFLSEEFAKTVACVLAANGFDILLSKTYCPTPCVSWMCKDTQAPGGVMITASHNPFQWNGVKFKEGYGGSASPEFTAKVEAKIQENGCTGKITRPLPFEEAVSSGKIRFFDPAERYVNQLRSLLDLEGILKRNWKIAYDPLFGAGSGFLEKVLGVPVTEIHGESNPGFGGLNPEPIDKNLNALMTLVGKEKFDVGLATDGDADRIGAIDENGNFVNSHQIFTLIMMRLIEKGLKGDVIKTVSTTGMIDRLAERHGIKVHETPIGFKYICGKFLECTPLMGGEESGGIGLPFHVYERDGLLSGLLLLEIMSSKGKRLGELLRDLEKEIGSFHFVREDLHLAERDLQRIRETLPKLEPSSIGSLKVSQVNRLDGLKFVLEDGSWLLLRPSGTEPLIRVYAEAAKSSQAQQLIQEGKKLLKISS